MDGEGEGRPGGGSLRVRTVRGVGIVLAFRLLTVVYQVFKARLLDAAAVGIVSIGETLVGFAQTLAGLGIEPAAVQAAGDERTILNTALRLRLLVAVPCYAALWWLAPAWGAWAGEVRHAEDVAWVVRLLGLNLVIGTFSIVPSVQFTRRLAFGRVESAQIAALVLSSLLGIYLLWSKGMGYRAVAISAVAQVATYAVLVTAMNPSHFGRTWDRQVAGGLLGYGQFVLASSALIYLINNLDNAIVGRIRGLGELGVYAMAFSWGNRVVADFAHVTSKVVFPALSRLQSDPDRFRNAYLHTLRFGSFLVCPMALGLAGISEAFVPRVLGAKWDPDVTSLLPIWCAYGCLRSFGSFHGDALQASGRPRLVTLTSALFLGFAVPVGIVATRWKGALGLTVTFLAASFLANLFALRLVRQALGVRVRELASRMLLPLAAAGLMAAGVWALGRLWPGRSWSELAVLVVAGMVLYLTASLLVQRSTLREAWGLVLSAVAGPPPSSTTAPTDDRIAP